MLLRSPLPSFMWMRWPAGWRSPTDDHSHDCARSRQIRTFCEPWLHRAIDLFVRRLPRCSQPLKERRQARPDDGGRGMGVEVKVELGGNTIVSTPVMGDANQILTLSALDGAAAADGTWQKDGGNALPTKSTGVYEVVVGAASEGTYKFTPKKNPADKKTVTLKMNSGKASHRIKSFLGSVAAVFIGLIVYGVLVALILFYGNQASSAEGRSVVVGILTLVTLLGLVDIAGRVGPGKPGLSALFNGKDQRASTSKIQYLLWTLLLGYILAFVAAYAAITSGTFQCGTDVTRFCIPGDEAIWTPYLILLGVPAATAAVAKGIVSTKVSNGTLQKTEAQQANLAQVATTDAGDADLVDIQYLLFNLIAFVYVLVVFINDDKLATVPDLLLGLTSAAAGTFVLNKSLLNNKPLITSVTPSQIKPGDTLTVRGENLLVPDAEGSTPNTLNAKVAGLAAVAQRYGESKDTVTIQVPEGIATASTTSPTLTVITKANIETDGFPISLVPITVVGWKDAASIPKKAEDRKLVVTGLPKHGEIPVADRATVLVTLGGMSAPGEITADNEVSFKVPAARPGADNQSEVTVAFQGRTSAAAKVPLDT